MTFILKHQIEKDITLLVENNLITLEQAGYIKEFYSNKAKPTLETSMLLPLIGVLLIGAGLIALCAANWDYLTDQVRLFIAFIPLIILNYCLFKYKNSPSDVLIQCLTFGVSFASLFAMGIVANVFQTPVATEVLVHLCLFCIVPLVYVFDAYWLGVIGVWGAVFSSSDDYIILSLLGLIAFFPYCYFRLKEQRSSNTLMLFHIVILFRIGYFICYDEFAIFLPFAILLVIGLFFNNDLYRRTIKLMFFGVGVFFSFARIGIFSFEHENLVFAMVYGLLLCFALYYTLQHITYTGSQYDKIFNLQSIAILSLLLMNLSNIPTDFIATLLMSCIWGYNAFTHFKLINIKGYNKYSFVFTALVLAKMTSLSLDFATQGIMFIILGVGFIILSRHVNNLMKIELASLDATEVV